mmetsp:Transcript_44783/g.140418  ORF Transcript_44783/g.140418 Transcript_44783/m.140418 type:complete len:109 (-) Transcript_44783:922-1248(-)
MAPEEPREREVPEWLSAALLYDVAKRGYDGVMSLPVLRRVAPGVQDIAEIFLERCGVPHGHDSALECADGHIETFLEQVRFSACEFSHGGFRSILSPRCLCYLRTLGG